MAGAWLTAIARVITTNQAFNDIVAPAIADLQHEAGYRRGAPWTGYVAGAAAVATRAALDRGHPFSAPGS